MNPFFIAFVAIVAIAAFAAYRNYWTYEARMKLLRDDYMAYQNLASYYKCFWTVWVWDITKFVK